MSVRIPCAGEAARSLIYLGRDEHAAAFLEHRVRVSTEAGKVTLAPPEGQQQCKQRRASDPEVFVGGPAIERFCELGVSLEKTAHNRRRESVDQRLGTRTITAGRRARGTAHGGTWRHGHERRGDRRFLIPTLTMAHRIAPMV